MTTEKTISKLCTIAPLVSDIMDKLKGEDSVVVWAKDYTKATNKVEQLSSLLRLLPTLAVKCGNEFYNVVAVLTDKTVDEVKTQNFGVTVNDVKTIFNDEVFRSFFTLSSKSESETTGVSVE